MLNSIGNMALVRCREVVRFSEGPLSEARLYNVVQVADVTVISYKPLSNLLPGKQGCIASMAVTFPLPLWGL